MKKNSWIILALITVLTTACGTSGGTSADGNSTEKESLEAQNEAKVEGNSFANDFIEMTIPSEFDGICRVENEPDTLSVIYKEGEDAGYGGLEFYVWVREVTPDYAGGPQIKIGELVSADGKDYDVVVGYPSEVQWDFNKSYSMPEDYKRIADAEKDICNTIQAVNGATYKAGAGIHGEDLYGDVLDKYVKAVSEGWDANKLEEEKMSPQFYEVATFSEGNAGDRIGFAYLDVNLDGVDELFVGEIAEGDFKGVVYDIYTVVNRQPQLVVSGSARNRYFVYDNAFIVNEYSGGAAESGSMVYNLDYNTTEMTLQWGTKYDGYENEAQPWFITYDGEEWENVTEEDYNNRVADTSKYVRFDYTPLSSLAK